ncbi:MAG: disulfide bond formation protein B [Betaproteobacteria bacterium]|nr:disulfide bond formation protein B [Betaproteobacteria bacterium]
MNRSSRYFIAIAIFAFAAVGVALVLQTQFDMQPCAWCVMQRLIYLSVGAFALLALVTPQRIRRLPGAFAVFLSITGIGIALYQQFVAAQSESCGLSFAERFMSATGLDSALPTLFGATASCSEANVPLLGVPFAWWSVALFALLAVLGALALASRR